MAAGLPVITTPNAGSIIRDGLDGVIVPIRDVDALAEKILWMYEKPESRHEFGIHAASRVEEFSWEHYGQRLLAFYEKILQLNLLTGDYN